MSGSRVEKIQGITRLMVRSMKESLKVPHFGYGDEVSRYSFSLPPASFSHCERKKQDHACLISHLAFHLVQVAVDELARMRRLLNDAELGVKLSYMPIILKATSLALSEFPILNSSISPDETEIIYHGHHHIGVAMDTPRGLLVPNIKHVEQKSILEIALDLQALQVAGLEGKLGEGTGSRQL